MIRLIAKCEPLMKTTYQTATCGAVRAAAGIAAGNAAGSVMAFCFVSSSTAATSHTSWAGQRLAQPLSAQQG